MWGLELLSKPHIRLNDAVDFKIFIERRILTMVTLIMQKWKKKRVTVPSTKKKTFWFKALHCWFGLFMQIWKTRQLRCLHVRFSIFFCILILDYLSILSWHFGSQKYCGQKAYTTSDGIAVLQLENPALIPDTGVWLTCTFVDCLWLLCIGEIKQS